MITVMFRTRDLLLISTVVLFLFFAIGVTVWNQSSTNLVVSNPVILAEVSSQEYTAEVYVKESQSREERLDEMRKKIANSGDLSFSTPVSDLDTDLFIEIPEESVVSASEESEAVMPQCPRFSEYSGLWPVEGVLIDVVEGARLVYQEIVSEYEPAPAMATSGTLLPLDTRRDVLLQLSIRTEPMPGISCLVSNVIGVAKDGSLIRNNEAGLYGVFGEGTLIGYALDGFPIYGTADFVGDACGGQTVNGQYGYYLSVNRKVIMNCFAAVPISL
ncbi:MAG: hypothetical protein ACI9BF_000407 [Candidatus Paceibacteria bacterium]|jgi:hypothetical protein